VCTFFYNSMCVSIENIIQKKNCQSSRWTQLSNGYLLPEAQPLQPFAFNPGQKKKACPQNDDVWGPLRNKKKPSGLLTPAGLHNGRSLRFRRCKLSTRPPTLSPPFSSQRPTATIAFMLLQLVLAPSCHISITW